jgi:gamma-glutamyltranspeptidase
MTSAARFYSRKELQSKRPIESIGSRCLSTPQSGIVLNDQLLDFTKDAWVERFGLTESPNRARPSARPTSSMTPTIVTKDGEVVLALGGSGGMNIATDISQVVLHALLFDAPIDRVSKAPRFQLPMSGATVRVKSTLSAAFVRDLESRGEVVTSYEATTTAVQMVRVVNGTVSAAADPQKGGLALVR